jgi:hypothetical protein
MEALEQPIHFIIFTLLRLILSHLSLQSIYHTNTHKGPNLQGFYPEESLLNPVTWCRETTSCPAFAGFPTALLVTIRTSRVIGFLC